MPRLAPLPVLAFTLLLAGCAGTPRVVSSGSQAYTVTAEEGLRWNTTTVPPRELVFKAANRYCTKRQLVMVPVSLDLRPGEFGIRPATADLVFRALPPGDPRIARSQMIVRKYDPLVVRESVVKFSADATGQSPPRRP